MIKVLVISKTSTARTVLADALSHAKDLQLVGVAPDIPAARDMSNLHRPDVVAVHLEAGLEALEVLGSLLALKGATILPVVPPTDSASISALCDRLRAVGRGAISRPAAVPLGAVAAAGNLAQLSQKTRERHLIAIGASTGGTEALRVVLSALPADVPGVVIVQHMPDTFTGSFARRLDSQSALTVIEAKGGERILPGHAYLAPGHSHLLVKRSGAGWVTELSKSDPVNRHRPSVDVLFDSVANEVGAGALGVILTGMGKDGAAGMLAMHKAGAWNIGQDQASCVVYGMPREAALLGALDDVSPLAEIAARVQARLRLMDKR